MSVQAIKVQSHTHIIVAAATATDYKIIVHIAICMMWYIVHVYPVLYHSEKRDSVKAGLVAGFTHSVLHCAHNGIHSFLANHNDPHRYSTAIR